MLLMFTLGGVVLGIQLGRALERKAQTLEVAPPAAMEAWQDFQPTDTAPVCLPSGTVAYEICDPATHMRYWVLRWPEGKGYSVVPRMVYEDGQMVPYWPDYEGGSDDGS